MSDLDPRAVMAAAIMNALIDSQRLETGEAIIDPLHGRHALVVCLAMMLEPDPSLRTSKDMREMSEVVARELRAQLRVMREQFEKTGLRAWDAKRIQ